MNEPPRYLVLLTGLVFGLMAGTILADTIHPAAGAAVAILIILIIGVLAFLRDRNNYKRREAEILERVGKTS